MHGVYVLRVLCAVCVMNKCDVVCVRTCTPPPTRISRQNEGFRSSVAMSLHSERLSASFLCFSPKSAATDSTLQAAAEAEGGVGGAAGK